MNVCLVNFHPTISLRVVPCLRTQTMPPTWSIGFHQCRWGYTDIAAVQAVVDAYAAHQLPLDTMWTDIDYMQNYLDFTTDSVHFPVDKLQTFISELHAKGQVHSTHTFTWAHTRT